MKEKVVEILIFIMSEIQDNKHLHEIDLTELKEKGYTQSEISAAFSWLYDNIQAGEGTLKPAARAARGSRRVFHEAEKQVLSTESQGYLMQMSELDLLDDKDLETVIERAMMTGYQKLTVSEVREIVMAVLFAKQANSAAGNRSMLDERDTIQ